MHLNRAWMRLVTAVWRKTILLSFLYFHRLFSLSARETSSGKNHEKIYKTPQNIDLCFEHRVFVLLKRYNHMLCTSFPLQPLQRRCTYLFHGDPTPCGPIVHLIPWSYNAMEVLPKPVLWVLYLLLGKIGSNIVRIQSDFSIPVHLFTCCLFSLRTLKTIVYCYANKWTDVFWSLAENSIV